MYRNIVNIFPSRLSACLSGLLHTLRAVVVGNNSYHNSYLPDDAHLASFTCQLQLVRVLGGSIVPDKCKMQSRLCSQSPARTTTFLSRAGTSNAPFAKLGLPCAKAQLPKHDMAASTCLASNCSQASCQTHLKLRCSPHSKDVQLGTLCSIINTLQSQQSRS